MAITLGPIESAAIRRAELADPNLRRCLIENCATPGAVELVHVFSRETSPNVIKAIEWNWGMAKGSLNLDTRQNIFFLGASMHELYRKHRCALLPEEDVLDQYHNSTGKRILCRGSVAKIKEGIFKYRLLPIQFMEDIYLTRQSSDTGDDTVTIHSYPFEDLPVITSHINPRFATLHLGQLLCDIRIETRKAIKSKIPWLERLVTLYRSWTWFPPSDREYYFGVDFEDVGEQPDSNDIPDDEADRTPLCRIRTIAVSEEEHVAPLPIFQFQRDPSTSSWLSTSSGGSDHILQTNPRKGPAPEDDEAADERPRKRLLTSEALKMQRSRKDLPSARWTADKISLWAQSSFTPSMPCPKPPAPSPPVMQPQPPRRSARLLAKRKRG